MEWLMNPWVIIIIVVSVVIGNLAALKATANMKFGQSKKMKNLQEQDDIDAEKQNTVDKKENSEQKKTLNNERLSSSYFSLFFILLSLRGVV